MEGRGTSPEIRAIEEEKVDIVRIVGYYKSMKKGTYIEVGRAFANEAAPQIPNILAAEYNDYLEWTVELSYLTKQAPNTYGVGGLPLPDVYGYAFTLYISGNALNNIMKRVRQTS